MYNLFEMTHSSSGSRVQSSSLDYVKRIIQRECTKVQTHYRSSNYYIDNSHLLCRIIKTSMGSMSSSYDVFVNNICSRANSIARHFNLTSSISIGTTHKGVFYGRDSEEIIIIDDSNFDENKYIDNYNTIKAIEVLSSPINDLSCQMPRGIEISEARGLSIIIINLAKLMLQYRLWLEYHRGEVDPIKLTESHFLMACAFPSMLESHMDIAVFNRFSSPILEEPYYKSLSKYPFAITDTSMSFDKASDDLRKYLKEAKLLYMLLLKSTPSVYKTDALEVLAMPDMAKTRQLWWALLLARSRAFMYMLKCSKEHSWDINRSSIGALKIIYSRMLSDKVMQQVLSPQSYQKAMSDIDYIMSI